MEIYFLWNMYEILEEKIKLVYHDTDKSMYIGDVLNYETKEKAQRFY